MEFKNVKKLLADNFASISSTNTLFEVDIDKDHLYNLYLNSFPEGTNPIYRKRRYYDCSACCQFIKNIGGTIYIDKNLVSHSIFEFDTHSKTFQPVMDALATYVTSKPIIDIYFNNSPRVGIDHNRELIDDGTVITLDHFFVNLPYNMYIRDASSIPSEKAKIRDRKNVFKRSLDEISMEAIDTVLELISANTLYKGAEWKTAIERLREFKEIYSNIPDDKKDLYTWRTTPVLGDAIGRIRNHSIGVLLIDISEGMDLDAAVRRYENIVDHTRGRVRTSEHV